jgi:hypothetical protein
MPFIVSAYAKKSSCRDPLISRLRTTSSFRIAVTYVLIRSALCRNRIAALRTNSCRAPSAGGRYGVNGALRRNADDSTEKYRMIFPTISLRCLLTGVMKSRRTVCARWRVSQTQFAACKRGYGSLYAYETTTHA